MRLDLRRSHSLKKASASPGRLRSVLYALAFLMIGGAILAVGAATYSVSMEAETGTAAGQAVTADKDGASAGKAVNFGSGSNQPSWKPLRPGTHWQWQLTGTVNENALDNVSGPKMMDIDMFNATPALVSRLKAKDIYVVCYVESGDWASGRPDAGDYAPAILGKAIDGFPDEKFINVTALDGPAGPTGKTLRQIMHARLDLAKSKGCDGVEPDLDDLHTYDTGFTISKTAMVAYNKAMIDAAHDRGMSMGLKNGPSGSTGAASFEKLMLDAGADWALNEECNQFDECQGYSQFIAAGKAVFQVEYLDNQVKPYAGTGGTCALDNAAGFDGIVKDSSSILAASPLIHCR